MLEEFSKSHEYRETIESGCQEAAERLLQSLRDILSVTGVIEHYIPLFIIFCKFEKLLVPLLPRFNHPSLFIPILTGIIKDRDGQGFVAAYEDRISVVTSHNYDVIRKNAICCVWSTRWGSSEYSYLPYKQLESGGIQFEDLISGEEARGTMIFDRVFNG